MIVSYKLKESPMAKIINFNNGNRDMNEIKTRDRKSIVKKCASIITIIATFCTISGVTVLSFLDKDWQEISETYNNEGLELYDLGKYEEAIELYDKAINLENKGIRDIEICYYNRGRAYFKLENYEKAIGDYTKAIEISPKSKYYSDRAVAYERLGEYEKAALDNMRALTNITE